MPAFEREECQRGAEDTGDFGVAGCDVVCGEGAERAEPEGDEAYAFSEFGLIALIIVLT